MELNDIYYGDAYELIKQIDDKSIDLIITDPPYEFTVNQCNSKLFRDRKIKKYKRIKNIYCSDECKNTIKELKNLTYKKDKKGNIIEDEFNIDPHTFSAIWYALDGYEVSDLKQFDRSKYGI